MKKSPSSFLKKHAWLIATIVLIAANAVFILGHGTKVIEDRARLTAASSGSNLAQSYAYDDTGYHSGSDCPDYTGTWQDCPNQPPPPACTPSCSNTCGGSDGCGGTCGNACTIGCASASDTNQCGNLSSCSNPLTQTRSADGASTGICGTYLSYNGNGTNNPYTSSNLTGTVTQSDSKTGSKSYTYICSQSDNSSSHVLGSNGNVDCGGVSGFTPSAIVPGNTDDTGTYYEDTGWWDVAMEQNGFESCDTTNNGTDYAPYPAASAWFKSQTSYCSHIYYACEANDTNTPQPCGHQGSGPAFANFNPSMVRHTGHASYYKEDSNSNNESLQGAGGNAATTHSIGAHYTDIQHDVPPYPKKIPSDNSNGWPINGWIPKGTQWYVYRQVNDCAWSPTWTPTTSADAGNYSSCQTPSTYAPYGTISCLAGTSGVAIDVSTFTRPNPTTSSATTASHASDYGFCYAAPASLTATPLACGSNQIQLSWAAVVDPKHTTTSYNIQIDGAPLASGVTGTTYTYTVGDTASHTYTVAVTSQVYGPEASRTGPTSTGAVASVAASAPATCPASPSNLLVTADSQTQITLHWNDNSSNETGFKIERKTGAGGTYALVTTAAQNAQSYTNTGLTANTTYYYRVTATNSASSGGGDSGYVENSGTTWASAPTSVSLTAATNAVCGSGKIDLSWSATGATGYKLYRQNVDLSYTRIYPAPDITGTEVSFTDINRTNAQSYSYKVDAYAENSGGNAITSATASASAPQICAPTPTGFTATAPNDVSCGKYHVNIAWFVPTNGATNYNVKRDGTSLYNADGTSLWNGTNYAYTDPGLTPASSHNYTLTYTNAGGSASTNANPAFPTVVQSVCAPDSLQLTPQSSSAIRLDWSWTEQNNNPANFKIERSLNGTSGWTDVTSTCSAALQSGSYWCSNTGLAASTLYYYRVKEVNSGVDSSPTGVASATTFPGAPSNLSASTISNTQINLSWTGSGAGMTYNIYRRTSAGSYSGFPFDSTSATTYQNTGLSANTAYVYKVTATNAANGTSASSNESSATTNPNVPGSSSAWATTGASCGSKQINVGWYPATDASTYQIYRGTFPSGVQIYNGNGVNNGAVSAQDGNGLTYYTVTDTVAADNTSYNYYITASNVTGTGSRSTMSATSPQICAPSAPSSLAAVAATKNQINLTWVDNSVNESGFIVERSINGTGFTQLDTVGAGVTSYSDDNFTGGLTPNRQYWYRVKATNAAGDSAYTAVATTWTLMNNPTGLVITATTNASCGTGKIDLAWSAVGATTYTVKEGSRVVIANTTSTSISDSGLTAASTHTYTLYANATNAGGTVTVTQNSNQGTAPQVCAPTPTGFTSTVPLTPACGANWINIAWYPTDAVTYTIKDGSRVVYTGSGSDKISGDHFALSDINLNYGSVHSYTLTLTNPGGSTVVQAAPRYPETVEELCTTPSVVLTAQSTNIPYNTAPTLTWTPTGQEISSCTAGGGWSGSKNPAGGTQAATSITAPTTYTIYCTNPGGDSLAASVTVDVAASFPTGLTATAVSQAQINLSWFPPAPGGLTGFKIWRKTGLNGSYGATPIATVGSGATTYQSTSLAQNATYYYKVSAIINSADSPYSNEANATTLPNAPTAPATLTATPGACGTGNISLDWAASSGIPTSYTITDTASGGHTYTIQSPNLSVIDSGLTASSTHAYRITASNAGGTSTPTVTSPVNTTAPPLCTDLSFSADNLILQYHGGTTLRWTPVNAISCTASGGWSGPKDKDGGTEATGNLSATTIYNLSCTSPGGTTQKSVTVQVVPPSTITVNSNVNSSWTINPGSINGSGSGVHETVIPALNGTVYSINASDVGGYDSPSITSSVGGGSSLTLFGGESESFTLNYARAFNYNLTNGGSVHIEKGGINQFGQTTVVKTLAANSGPSKPVDLTLNPLPSGITYAISGSTCSPNCSSSITFTVTPQAQSGNYAIEVTGSPLGKTTDFTLSVTDSPDMVVSCTHTPLTAKVGEPVTWTATVAQSPSHAPYTFSLSGDNIPANVTSTDSSAPYTASYTVPAYSTTGAKTFAAIVRDANQNIARCASDGSINISVNPQFQEF